MENVSHNTSYSEGSPNVHQDDEEFGDSLHLSQMPLDVGANQS